MTNHRVEWKGPQPTIDEALEFSDLGLPAMEYANSYGRALRALAAEVRRLRGSVEPTAPRFLLEDTGINANDGALHISIRFKYRAAYEKALTFLDVGNALNREAPHDG